MLCACQPVLDMQDSPGVADVVTEVGLLILAVTLAVYDLRTRRVPNWVTLPLLVTGLVQHFPGAAGTWLGCLLLFSAWHFGVLGGDAKLWMALRRWDLRQKSRFG